jgi:hydroxyacylglutathione hydrolase
LVLTVHPEDRRMNILPIPAFNDNYIWLIETDAGAVIVVDPGDSKVVKQHLANAGHSLSAILITHHHPDHTGGVDDLAATYNARVIGPVNCPYPHIKEAVNEGDTVTINDLSFSVLSIPGHTLDHIAFYCAEEAVLFCGDTVFSGGCGRVFEGTHEQMRDSIDKLRKLPGHTNFYPAHEYTESNLRFALLVEPKNKNLVARISEVKALRARGEPTLPCRLDNELLTNPFLRWDAPEVMSSAFTRSTDASEEAVFGIIREWKNHA